VKVLYFSRSYTPHDHRFLRRLANTDYTVYFMQIEETISSRENRPIPRGIVKIHWDGGKRSLELKNIRRNKTSLERVLKDLKPDLVHAGPVQMSAFLTALTGFRPLISMSWGSDLLWDARKGLGRWIARYTLSRSTIFLCDCNTVSQAGQALGMPRERIIQFPWGVDLDHFSPGSGDEVRETLGWENATILLSTRSWEPMYGVDILCQAFLHIAQKEDEICLLLLGDGSLRDQIKAMFHSSGLEDRIHLAGFVDQRLPRRWKLGELVRSDGLWNSTSRLRHPGQSGVGDAWGEWMVVS
jgi:glycosyltransferase involved in cell wall biosynthesis